VHVFVWSKYACCSRVLCTVVGVHMRPYLQWACAIALPNDIENVTINGPFVGKKVPCAQMSESNTNRGWAEGGGLGNTALDGRSHVQEAL
jgi:hypothetical protein